MRNFLQAKVGRVKELEAALRRLRGERADFALEAADIIVTSQKIAHSFIRTFSWNEVRLTQFVLQEYTENLQQIPKATIVELFQRRYDHSLIVSLIYLNLISCHSLPV